MAFKKFADDDIEPEKMHYSFLFMYQRLSQEKYTDTCAKS